VTGLRHVLYIQLDYIGQIADADLMERMQRKAEAEAAAFGYGCPPEPTVGGGGEGDRREPWLLCWELTPRH
jgi:hypothetical protein